MEPFGRNLQCVISFKILWSVQGKTWAEKAVLAAGAVTFGSVVAIVVLMVRGWQLQDPLLKGICAAGIAGAAAIVALVNFIRKPSKGGSASPQAA